MHGLALALQSLLDLGVPVRGVRRDPLLRQLAVGFAGRFVQPQLDHGKIGAGLFQVVPQAQVGEAGLDLAELVESGRKWTSIRSPLWPSNPNAALFCFSMAASAEAASSRIAARSLPGSARQAAQRTRIIWCRTAAPSIVKGTGGILSGLCMFVFYCIAFDAC